MSIIITADTLVSASRNVVNIDSYEKFCQTIAAVMLGDVKGARAMEDIRSAYLAGFESDNTDDYSPEQIAAVIANVATAQLEEVREQLTTDEIPDTETKWTDYEGYNLIQSAYTNLRQRTRTIADGHSWLTTNRISPLEFAQGKRTTFEIAQPKTPAKRGKRITATGKTKGRKAQGANVPTPEQGASAFESVLGDKDSARAMLRAILKDYPEFAIDPALSKDFDNAVKAATKSASAEKIKDKKAA